MLDGKEAVNGWIYEEEEEEEEEEDKATMAATRELGVGGRAWPCGEVVECGRGETLSFFIDRLFVKK